MTNIKGNIKVDPRLTIPYVQGINYADDVYSDGETGDEIVELNSSDVIDWSSATAPVVENPALLPPDHIEILSQTFRLNEVGQAVVDVLIEVFDVPGAVEYEVRMSV